MTRPRRFLAAGVLLGGLAGCAGGPEPASPPPAERESASAAAATPYQAESTRRMAERLEQLAAAADPGIVSTVGSDVRVAHWRQQIDQAPDLPTWVRMYAHLGDELLMAGRTDEALAALIGLREALARAGAGLGEQTSRGLGTLMATAYLRQGEQDNCLARHGPDSCLMPIQGSGVHVDPAGSTGAIKELVALLEADPDDLASRWLLNLAHMTLGSYPDGVPEAWLVPPSLFGAQAAIERFPNVASRAGVDVKGLSGGVVIEVGLDAESGWRPDGNERVLQGRRGAAGSGRQPGRRHRWPGS